jgi:YVTN family beta-propeller protein
MKSMFVTFATVIACILAAACGGRASSHDTGPGHDSGTDSGQADAGWDSGTDPGLDGGADAGVDAGADGGIAECLYTPAAFASEQTHLVDDGVGILPNGRAITPAGNQVDVGFFPGNMIMTPDGKTLIISDNGMGDDDLVVVDTESGTIRQTVKSHGNWLLYGLAVTQDGKTLFAAGGPYKGVYVYSISDTGMLAYVKTFGTVQGKIVTGLRLSADGKVIYVTDFISNSVSVYDAATQDFITSNTNVTYAFDAALSADGSKLYVSNWGQIQFGSPDVVTVVKASDLTFLSNITVGKNPEKIIEDPANSRLFVLNSDQETISVVDTATDTVKSTVSLLSSADSPTGVFPVGGVLSKDGSTLYVAAAAKNSVEVIDTATLKVRGSIPTGWYPTAVELSSDGTTLFVVNGKGGGSGPNDDKVRITKKMMGTLSIIDVPSAAQLVDMTNRVAANNLRTTQYYPVEQCAGQSFPVPFAVGGGSPIEHVVFIVKENRTFDQVFGDFAGADGNPALVLFGENIAPNHYALARRFGLMDNFYAESEISEQGHQWTAGMEVNDLVERQWILRYRGADYVQPPLAAVEPYSSPLNPYLFARLEEMNMDFVDYGEVVGMENQPAAVTSHWDQNYPGKVWTLSVTDKARAQYFIQKLNSGYLPTFTYMILPCDHTKGTHKGDPSPESFVADNDEGLGMIVDALSKSPFWGSTAVFVTEDDPQDGYDHVDAHRTVGLVISPWTRNGYISNVHYSFASMYATFERMLGIKPLNTYDANAAPMMDLFTNIPDMTPYNYIPRKVPETLNTADTPYAAESEKLDFSVPDRAEGLAEILWGYMKGGRPYPGGADDD